MSKKEYPQNNWNPIGAEDIEAATKSLLGVVKETPLEESLRLSKITGVPIYLKREDQQICRSFKARGAYNKICSLSASEKQNGVVCASAGNHAQGVANACQTLGIKGTIYLPMSTPHQKRQRIRAIGGQWVELEFVDGNFDRAQEVALLAAKETKRTYIHPYDDPLVIAGQGSVAQEIATQLGSEIHNVIVPIGGGGLISGMAAWLKARHPEVRIIGVEATGSASAWKARQVGAPETLVELDSFVDGTAVGRVGEHTFALIEELVDDLVVVSEGAVCTEILDLYHLEGIIAEPAGALASAALVASAGGRIDNLNLEGPTTVIISGGNNDLSRYPEIMERSMHYRGLRHYFLVSFPQQPGALRHFLDDVLGPEDDIVFFEYTKKNNRDMGPALVGIDISHPNDIKGLLKRMDTSPLHIEGIPADSDLLRFLV